MKQSNIYLTSDLHLNHANIIKYCNRPFANVEEMNESLISKWNKTIKKDDIVLFLGDLALTKGKKDTDYWLSQLNGVILFFKGNHDKKSKTKVLFTTGTFTHQGVDFFITHDPANKPKDWTGWTLSGHHHNNWPLEFPLINPITKTINVSTELTGYMPILLDELINLIGEVNK